MHDALKALFDLTIVVTLAYCGIIVGRFMQRNIVRRRRRRCKNCD